MATVIRGHERIVQIREMVSLKKKKRKFH